MQVAVHTRVVHLFFSNAVDNLLRRTNLLADLSHRVEGLGNYRAYCLVDFILFGGVNREVSPPNNERQKHTLNHHRQQNHTGNNEDNEVASHNIVRHRERYCERNAAAESGEG